MFEKKPNPKSKTNPCFELLKRIMEMITEQTVFFKKKTTLKDIEDSNPTGSEQGFTWASILCY